MSDRPLLVPEAARASIGGEVSLAGVQTRLASRMFSSSVGMLILIPGLMLLAGAGLVLMGQTGLRRSIETSLRQRVTDQASEVARATDTSLGQAQPLLAVVREHLIAHREPDPAVFAGFARTLIEHRPGVSFISFSGVDGTFRGVFIDHEHDGAIRLNHSWIDDQGITTKRISDIASDDTLVAVETQRDTKYDPRTRPFFAPAVAAKGPVWTDPYPFYLTDETGITCALAIRDPASGDLLGVATVDFDLSTLSAIMRTLVKTGVAGSVAFLFAADGTVLASSLAAVDDAARATRTKTLALMAHELPAPGESVFTDLAGTGLPDLAGIRAVQVPDGPVWYAGIRAPRDVLAAEANTHLRRTLMVGLAGLAIAVGLAALLANYLARQKNIANVARAAAASAKEKLQAMGSYTLIKELGAGGMGSVWLAEHHMLARPAALKLIKLDLIARTDGERTQARARFEREAKATASLRSRNTVTLYDYGLAADGSFYYAMELLDGLDLDKLVTDFGPQPAGRVAQILIQACNSLAEAHQRGMVHRDIKPANIYLCRLGLEVDVVKVLDFGLVAERVKGSVQLTTAGVVQGTPAFMAPEQAQGEALDGRVDLYALGCVAYWLLSGRMVFEKDDPMAVMIDHINTPPQPLSTIAKQPIPPELEALVMSLLAKEPDQRPANAQAVIATLRTLRIPDDQQWPADHAEGWWTMHRPSAADGNTADAQRSNASSRDAATLMLPQS